MAPHFEPVIKSPPRRWFLGILDGLLSETLRRAPRAELIRSRVLVGFALFATVFNSLYLLAIPLALYELPTLLSGLAYLATLVVARRAHSLMLPAWLVCVTASMTLVASVFMSDYAMGGTHAASMLLPALAVYLLGSRKGLPIALGLAVTLGLIHPLYCIHFAPGLSPDPPAVLLSASISAGICLMGAWLLSTLHSTAREAAQESLERAMRSLRESEGNLVSLVNNTEDLVCSLDKQLCLIACNGALREAVRLGEGAELMPGLQVLSLVRPETAALWGPWFELALSGQRVRREHEFAHGPQRTVLDFSLSPILGDEGQVLGITFFGRDITASKQAEARLRDMHRTLMDVSRFAGMAEIATGVLHNVGNTLNSVNISSGVLSEQVRNMRVSNLHKAAQLMQEHEADLGAFFTHDPRARKLPAYLRGTAEELEQDRASMKKELAALFESVEHIKSIVTMQQQHARTAGVVEQLPVPQLIQEALRLNAMSFERQGIHIRQDYAQVPSIMVDRHKLLQILINLLSNARHALASVDSQHKQLSLCIRLSEDETRLLIEVADNGVGIAPEVLPRMFSQGFTTKKTGHGFGLHISALAAEEMHGHLSCTSAGPGQGATFRLELPVQGEEGG